MLESGGSGSTSNQSCSMMKGRACGSSIAAEIDVCWRKDTSWSAVQEAEREGREKDPVVSRRGWRNGDIPRRDAPRFQGTYHTEATEGVSAGFSETAMVT